MRIAVVGPLDNPVQPDAPGGTEVWTANYVNELVSRNHEVTLFAAAESQTKAKLHATCSINDVRGADGSISKPRFALNSLHEMVEVVKHQEDFDVIHLSIYSLHHYLPLVELLNKPVVVTVHGSPFNKEEAQKIVDNYPSPHYVFISHSFAERWATPKNSSVIYNGISLDSLPFSAQDDGYFLFLGRICPEKGAAEAVKLANQAGVPLHVVGLASDQEYFDKSIRPQLSDAIKIVGQVGVEDKARAYAGARAVLMPINWEEPFGLVAVEAMACGTPVIAYSRGALPEIVIDNVTGYLVSPGDEKGFEERIKQLVAMDESSYQQLSQASRKQVEDHFTIDQMVGQYETLYQEITR